eukprot:9812712-Alexandrium_andersonii.AAC.1
MCRSGRLQGRARRDQEFAFSQASAFRGSRQPQSASGQPPEVPRSLQSAPGDAQRKGSLKRPETASRNS